MAHLLTNTGGEYHHAASWGLLAVFLLAGDHDGKHARFSRTQGDKAPSEFIQVVRVPPLRVCGMISHSYLDTVAIVGG